MDPATLTAIMTAMNMLGQKAPAQQLTPMMPKAAAEPTKSLGEILFGNQLPTNPQQMTGFPRLGGV